MTSRAEVMAVADLADRLQLVFDRNDEYPMRMLGEQLRAELHRLALPLDDPDLAGRSPLDPSSCGSDDLRSLIRCLIDTARQWERGACIDDARVAEY